ncbi:MAG: hypothetical protein ACI8XM_002629 [Haloarculaceae archaeon]|jgi:hypothetical protein
MVKRRKMLIGMGSLAAGSAAAVGSGAFTSALITRDADVTVANDKSAYIQLEKGGARGVGDKVGHENGELYIDLGRNASGSGVNDDARYQLGAMNDSATGDGISFESLYDSDSAPAAAGSGAPWVPSNNGTDQSAFVVRNRSGQVLDIRIGLNTSTANTNATVYLQGAATKIDGASQGDPSTVDGAEAVRTSVLDLDDPTQGQNNAVEALSFNNDNDPDEAIPPGESVYVSLQVDTRGGETSDGTSLSEELVVGANEAAEPGVE